MGECIPENPKIWVRIWPTATDEAQTALVNRDAYQWLVLFNIYGDKLSAAKETHEEHLIKGVPTNKKGDMRAALEELQKEGIVNPVSKEHHPVYYANSRHPVFQSSTNIEVLKEIRVNDALKDALIRRMPLLKRVVAPDLRRAIEHQWAKKKGPGYRLKIEVGDTPSEAHGDYSAKLQCWYPCPRGAQIGPYTFEVNDASEIFEKMMDIHCPICKKTHWIGANGSIRCYE